MNDNKNYRKHQEGEQQHPPDADHLGCMGVGEECVAMKRLI